MWFILSLASISSLKLQNKYFQFVFILNWNSSILKCLLKFNFAKCHPIQEIIKSFSIYEPWTWVGIKNKICLEFKIHRSLNHRKIHYLKVQLLSSIWPPTFFGILSAKMKFYVNERNVETALSAGSETTFQTKEKSQNKHFADL